MRGSPFLQAIFIVVVFALAGVPVWRLTRSAVATESAAPLTEVPAATPTPLEIEVVFAPAPADFQLRNLDRTVFAGRGPEARFTTRWTANVPPEGLDLVLQAHWPTLTAGDATEKPTGARPAAMRISVRFPDGRTVENSFWAAANGTLSAVYTLPGTAPAEAP